MDLKIVSDYKPTGDQPQAIKLLSKGISQGIDNQILLGVTGSGKTFTIANVLEQVQKPALILSHNKTLAAQLYSEFKEFFPNNAVEYFVSYYDYYQPEAYLPVTDTYIEKDLSINDEIEKLRLKTTSSLLSGRKDVIVVSSVSCLYGIGNPEDFHSNTIIVKQGDTIVRNQFLRRLVEALYNRNEITFDRGTFRVKGDTVDIFIAYGDIAYKIVFWGDEIDEIYTFDPINGNIIEQLDTAIIYPANIFVTTQQRINKAISQIQDDLVKQMQIFSEQGKNNEAKRIEQRVSYDIEMIKELGYCQGIENYSRYFDGRAAGTRPFCLLDYFPDDYITIIDESHVTIPQIRAMFGGDRARKDNLVNYGFRLPSALDNRPLKFDEFENMSNQTIYVSATPADFELEQSKGVVVEQVIRPTGLLDPIIEVRPSGNQIDDLVAEINECINRQERTLITTLTKRMAEELNKHLNNELGIKSTYIHSDVDTLERVKILEHLRLGNYDVLVGVNLLREGLDLPEVSLVVILDADKEGFLRSERSLTQTAGRAARNINGKVIMYADKITGSMQRTINETNRRREKQLKYNTDNNISPKPIQKAQRTMVQTSNENETTNTNYQYKTNTPNIAAEPVIQYMDIDSLERTIEHTKKKMERAADQLDFITAAQLRDEMFELQNLLMQKKQNKS